MVLDNIIPFPKYAKDRRKLIGKKINFVLSYDITRDGFLVRSGILENVDGRAVKIDDVWYYGSNIQCYEIIE